MSYATYRVVGLVEISVLDLDLDAFQQRSIHAYFVVVVLQRLLEENVGFRFVVLYLLEQAEDV